MISNGYLFVCAVWILPGLDRAVRDDGAIPERAYAGSTVPRGYRPVRDSLRRLVHLQRQDASRAVLVEWHGR